MVNAKEYEKIRQTINRLRQILDYSISKGHILLNEEALSLYTELNQNHPLELRVHILDWLNIENWDIDFVNDNDISERALVYLKQD